MINVKQMVVLALMAVGMSVLAGFLITRFNLTPYRNTMLVVIVILVLINIVLIYIAYKRGRLREIEL